MTVTELREMLEDLETDGRGDAQVLLATQPTYPLQATLRGVWDAAEDEDAGDDAAVYLVEGNAPASSPYGPRDAWDACRRR